MVSQVCEKLPPDQYLLLFLLGWERGLGGTNRSSRKNERVVANNACGQEKEGV